MPPTQRNKQFYCRQKALGIEQGDNFLTDLQGVFYTASINDNFKISREMYTLLKQYTEAIPNALEQEVHKFNKLLPGAKGVMFVYWPVIENQDTPQEAITKILLKKDSGVNLGCVANMVPINHTCKADLDLIKNKITKMLEKKKQNFGLEIKVRNNNGLTKQAVKAFLIEAFPDNYDSENELKVNIQICQCNAMIGWYNEFTD